MAITDRYVSSSGSATYAASTNSATPMSLATAFTSAVAGDRINIKNDGAYSFSSNTLCGGGNNTDPVIYRGYNTTPGDAYQGRTNGSGALITTNMPSITWTGCHHEWSDHTIVEGLNVSGNAVVANTSADNGQGFIWWTFSSCMMFIHCKVANSNGGGCLILNAATNLVWECDFSTSGSDGDAPLYFSGGAQRVHGCRITGGSAPAIQANNSAVITGSVLYRSQYGVLASLASGQFVIHGNTIVNNTNDGIAATGTGSGILMNITNNMLTDNGGYGANFPSCPHITLNNRIARNTSGGVFATNTDWGTASAFGDITTTGSDYVNAASDDYRLLTSSPAYQAGSMAYQSIGACTPQATAGGILLARGFNGGFNG